MTQKSLISEYLGVVANEALCTHETRELKMRCDHFNFYNANLIKIDKNENLFHKPNYNVSVLNHIYY